MIRSTVIARLVVVLCLAAVAFFFGVLFAAWLAQRVNGGLQVVGVGVLLATSWWMLETFRHLRAHLRGPMTEPAAQMLARRERGYVLLLRPFGSDATIRLRPLFWAGSPPVPIENIIDRACTSVLNARTYSLVDANSGVLSVGPRYVFSTADQWKRVVTRCLERAAVAVVLLVGPRQLGPSLRWELSKLVDLGFAGRTIFVLPPSGTESYDLARAALGEAVAYFGIPSVALGDEAPIVFLPQLDDSGKGWVPASRRRFRESSPYDAALTEALRECLTAVPRQLIGAVSDNQARPRPRNFTLPIALSVLTFATIAYLELAFSHRRIVDDGSRHLALFAVEAGMLCLVGVSWFAFARKRYR